MLRFVSIQVMIQQILFTFSELVYTKSEKSAYAVKHSPLKTSPRDLRKISVQIFSIQFQITKKRIVLRILYLENYVKIIVMFLCQVQLRTLDRFYIAVLQIQPKSGISETLLIIKYERSSTTTKTLHNGLLIFLSFSSHDKNT